MPDVTVDNPKVQIDLGNGESTTVPTGERFHVTIVSDEPDGIVQLNGQSILVASSSTAKSKIEIDLFGGDTIKEVGAQARIRGYRVD